MSGLVVLFVLLGGFVAMHGVAATTETGVHHSPVAVLAAPGHGMADEPGAAIATPRTGDGAAAADGGGEGHDGGHGVMTGCLVVLLAAVVAIVLRRSRPFRVTGVDGLLRSPQRVRDRPGRPPPRRGSRISLCVIRV